MKEDGDPEPTLRAMLNKAHLSDLYEYPTNFTQGIVPKAMHSHNDYWREVPFYTALSKGCISIEADVWLANASLYVGHEPSALTEDRTLEALYIEPLMYVLDRMNRDNDTLLSEKQKAAKAKEKDKNGVLGLGLIVLNSEKGMVEVNGVGKGKEMGGMGEKRKNGVYDMDSGQTIYLFVDVKTEGMITWLRVLEALEPLKQAGYLSYTDGKTFTWGPVTVIGTGNTPLDMIENVSPRHYFYDAPIRLLSSPTTTITSLISPIASANFRKVFGKVVGTSLSEDQLGLLREQVRNAHDRGIMVRYWETPSWPLRTRDGVWRQLKDEGVDLINADDLEGAASGLW